MNRNTRLNCKSTVYVRWIQWWKLSFSFGNGYLPTLRSSQQPVYITYFASFGVHYCKWIKFDELNGIPILLVLHVSGCVWLTSLCMCISACRTILYHSFENPAIVVWAMMTSSNGKKSRVTGPLCGKFTGPVNSPHKGQWRRALMVSLVCVWIKRWLNNRKAGDFRRHHARYEVIVIANT